MTFNLTNRRAIRDREKAARQQERDTEEIFRAILGEYAGRRWFHERFMRNHIFSSPFNTDPVQMAFNCGQQNDALQEFFRVVNICPEEYLQMMREAHERDLAADSKPVSGIDAEREAGNRAEAERIGLIAQRRADGEADDGDED